MDKTLELCASVPGSISLTSAVDGSAENPKHAPNACIRGENNNILMSLLKGQGCFRSRRNAH